MWASLYLSFYSWDSCFFTLTFLPSRKLISPVQMVVSVYQQLPTLLCLEVQKNIWFLVPLQFWDITFTRLLPWLVSSWTFILHLLATLELQKEPVISHWDCIWNQPQNSHGTFIHSEWWKPMTNSVTPHNLVDPWCLWFESGHCNCWDHRVSSS